jgi:adenylate cyclase
MTEQRRLAAILVADVVGYSKLVGSDEAGTLAKLQTLRTDLIEPAIAKHTGRLFKSVGDGFLVEFASAVQAVTCAKAIQETNNNGALQLRIGIHVGDVVVQGDDLMGDGVNVAARIESVADAGGIAISRQVRDQVRDKLSIELIDKGEVELKNIARPVRIFLVAGDTSRQAAATGPILALPDKPSIAVLPFQNMSGDPDQEYFVDGLVEDIITAMSRFKSLFVIARNSSFTYKGRAVDIKQVGRELGVRYVLEGSVRKAGNRLRITAQLIDATSGAHIWSDRFDGALEDVFALQDEMTVRAVAAIAPRVERAEIERARRRPPGNADAYDCYLRGLSCLSPASADSVMDAMHLFKQATALDPDYAAAYAMTMFCHVYRVSSGLFKDIEHERSEVTRLWRIVMQIGQEDGVALAQAAEAAAYVLRDLASAKRLIDQAVELNPNLATAWANSGWINVWLGYPDIALEDLGRAQRLDPGSNSSPRWTAMAHAFFFLDRYEEAEGVVEQGLQHSPDHIPGLRIGVASAALAGRSDVAHRLATHLRSLDPAFSITRLRKQLGPYKKAEFAEKYAQALRLAGFPE